MDTSIAIILAQDGCVSAAVYALLALGLVLVFSVTRVIFVSQGEMVSYSALTIAALQIGVFPHVVFLQVGLGWYVFALHCTEVLGAGHMVLQSIQSAAKPESSKPSLPVSVLEACRALLGPFVQFVLYPAALWWGLLLLEAHIPFAELSVWAQVLITLMVVAPLGPMLYRAVFEPLGEASVLVLLIVSVALHLVLMGAGLLMFGAEGGRSKALLDVTMNWGAYAMTGQSVFVIFSSLVVVGFFSIFFNFSMAGKALRATAVNRLGASLVGIKVKRSAEVAFLWAAFLGAFSGILIGPITTLYYDSGFIIGLKGFVGAVVGGLGSYPVAAAGALLVGLTESYVSFWASAYKEVWVFSLIIPVLMWRSFKSAHLVQEDETL